MGIWKYDETVGVDSPKLEKYCGVYKTLGDKRLGTHLISGLLQIMKEVIKIGVQQEIFTEEHLQ